MSDIEQSKQERARREQAERADRESAEPVPVSDAQAPERTTTAADDAEQAAPALNGDGDGEAAEVEGDLDELLQTAAQRDEYLALAQRTQADFENYRKRVARESAAAQARGAIVLAKELLPALDNLDRALESAANDDPLLEGVRLVRSELSAALACVGIKSFSPAGEVFDPALHEAVATSEQGAGGAASGTVVEVYQPGYRLAESIIRPARVVVAA
jgi:molecular chaperone GrpE